MGSKMDRMHGSQIGAPARSRFIMACTTRRRLRQLVLFVRLLQKCRSYNLEHFFGTLRRCREDRPPFSIEPKFWPVVLHRKAPAVPPLVRFWAGFGQKCFT